MGVWGEGDGEEVAQVELNKSQSSLVLCQAANIFMPGSFTLCPHHFAGVSPPLSPSNP